MTKYALFSACIFLFSCRNSTTPKSNATDFVFGGIEIENPQANELNKKGLSLAFQGKNREAEKYFLKALEIEPGATTILNNLGANSEEMGDLEKAISYYKKSINLSDSTNFMAITNLGLLHNKNKRYEKGFALWDYVVSNSEDDNILFSVYINRMIYNIKRKDCKQANKDYDLLKKYQYRQDIGDYSERIDFMYPELEKICPSYFVY